MDKVQLSKNVASRLATVDARRTEDRVNTCMKVVTRNLDMVEGEAHIKLIALVKLLAIFLVTELHHLPWREVRTQSFSLFRTALDEVHEKMEGIKRDE